tara:strand:- start:27 stop:299 length:273 start_codon:yes stop_codon:yes gene_type:complete
MRFSSTLNIAGDPGQRKVVCAKCNHEIGLAGKPWKVHAALLERPINELGQTYDLKDDVMLREFSCPACKALLDTELALAEDPYLDDILFD